MYAIETIGLTKKYKDVTAVNALNLSVYKGELLALLGVNGAGKTTAVKMLSCLTSPTEGDALVGGKSIKTGAAEVKRMIAVSSQETAVAPNLSVFENLALMCGVHGIKGDKKEARIKELTERFSFNEIINKKPESFPASGNAV